LHLWNQIAINNDRAGKMLMNGNQSMTAVALGMIAQDQYARFNEIIKQRMEEKEAKNNGLAIKSGYKKGVVRIWQKMASYENISAIKLIEHKFKVWFFYTGLCVYFFQLFFGMHYKAASIEGSFYGI